HLALHDHGLDRARPVSDLQEVELAAGAAGGEPAPERDGLPPELPHPPHRGHPHGPRTAEAGAGRRASTALAAPRLRRYTRVGCAWVGSGAAWRRAFWSPLASSSGARRA